VRDVAGCRLGEISRNRKPEDVGILVRIIGFASAYRLKAQAAIERLRRVVAEHAQALEALVARNIAFGVQTRIDLWKPELIDLLGGAGCVSVEAGVESLTPAGRAALDKNCRLSTEELTALLIRARRSIPFVQANLIKSAGDDAAMIEDWRETLRREEIWANDPVPLFPYPSSPDYRLRWGEPDEQAWERAHAHYLRQFDAFSDIQESDPLPLPEVESLSC